MSNLEEIRAAHRAQVAGLNALAAGAPAIAEQVAKEVASNLRVQAARSGHSIGIRIVRRPTGVRVTITGPHAQRYRKPLEDAMRARSPQVAAEIRAMTTRRP